ncbi:MAG: KpsF/GutQ family sugar-phosphate isomerase [Gammaproteobacteria bacterium]|nr:KpsF/GutQ family sugar-phosphate isomerase [Gammaproteobacteria bacterium]NNM21805.1 KpsF/GutQ family sugar-phosphate isomerase [Gammaproteobacteria bacterium]
MPGAAKLIELARRVLAVEAEAVNALQQRIGEEFIEACRLCLACRGRIVVTGIGKSGHIAGKIAATLASTGSPAFFMHPGEASHGDMGMITGEDVVIAVSNSGETSELVILLPMLRRLEAPLITLTGKADSTLATAATVNLDVSVAEEACPLNLAPTASTTATLAAGDALALALLEARGFTAEDFARSHPGGRLGRRLLVRVEDIMHSGDAVPRVTTDTLMKDALLEMTAKGLGMTAVVDKDGRVAGVFTDGDLRRTLDGHIDIHNTPISQLMTTSCKTVTQGILASEAVTEIETNKITGLLVVDENDRLVGALNIHDLFRAGVM